MLQDIVPFRFSNTLFEPLLSSTYVSSIAIRIIEDFGTEGRGGYFDGYGIIRDLMQNHLLQMLALSIMDQPTTLNANHVRDSKVNVLRQILPVTLEDSVLGQYIKDKAGKHQAYLVF